MTITTPEKEIVFGWMDWDCETIWSSFLEHFQTNLNKDHSYNSSITRYLTAMIMR